jgi:glycosyltransferase involved in cell wall biosynthesis
LPSMLSFIIPAHNEENWIGRCVQSIRTAMEKVQESCEIIVVDDGSTDATAKIAQQLGARTLRVEHRKVSAVRNSGARVASGDIFFFVDADTQINELAVTAALRALRAGAVGGGCVFDFDGPVPFWGRPLLFMGATIGRLIHMVGGCFVFCTREAYNAVGGFPETLAAGEEIGFIQALRRVGRFVVPKPAVVTSGRKLHVVNLRETLTILMRIAVCGPRYENKMILDFMYGQRAQACRRMAKDKMIEHKITQ